jgi:protease-4
MAEGILISDLFRNTWRWLTNRLRLLGRRRLDYVVFQLGGSYPERTLLPRRRFPLSLLPWPQPPPSVEAFANALEHLAFDPRVKGVVFLISDLSAGPATLSSLRQIIMHFRESGRRTVAYLQDLSMWPYYLAVACDEILVPESADFRAAGLWSEALFLKNTLSLLGIQADFEAIAEYKVSPDTFRRTKMTEPHREMLESMLDSLYDEVTGAIAAGRNMTAKRARKLLDGVPLTPQQAQEAGLLDGVCYEDELPGRIGSQGALAVLLPWDQARRRLVQPRRWYSHRAIGVVSLEGTIVPGSSRRAPFPLPIPLPVPTSQVGSDTLVQQLRAAAASRQIAAVVLHVDSPGGSALASDLIWRELMRLRHIKPLVVFMGNVAASGGYYVSAPASAIVAQATTLTGSIGIWGGKIVTTGLYDKIHARREVVSRGKAAGLYADFALFDEEERAKVRAELGLGYARFKARVAVGRNMTDEQVEAVARGRVWTGEQAMARGLVDALGDFRAAADRARELAGISPHRYAPLVDVPVPKRYQVAQPFPTNVLEWLDGLITLLHEGIFALAPWSIRIGGK